MLAAVGLGIHAKTFAASALMVALTFRASGSGRMGGPDDANLKVRNFIHPSIMLCNYGKL